MWGLPPWTLRLPSYMRCFGVQNHLRKPFSMVRLKCKLSKRPLNSQPQWISRSFKRGNLGSPRGHTLISPRDHTLTSPRPVIPSPHLDFLIHVFIPSSHLDIHTLTSPRLFVSIQQTLASPRLLNSLTLPDLTKPNLRSRAPNTAGASTHLS